MRTVVSGALLLIASGAGGQLPRLAPLTEIGCAPRP